MIKDIQELNPYIKQLEEIISNSILEDNDTLSKVKDAHYYEIEKIELYVKDIKLENTYVIKLFNRNRGEIDWIPIQCKFYNKNCQGKLDNNKQFFYSIVDTPFVKIIYNAGNNCRSNILYFNRNIDGSYETYYKY